MSDSKHSISIWFFIGALLLVYGILIAGAEIHTMTNPPAQSTIMLPELHAGLWWGLLLTVLGLVYVIKFRPGKQ